MCGRGLINKIAIGTLSEHSGALRVNQGRNLKPSLSFKMLFSSSFRERHKGRGSWEEEEK